MKYAQIRSIRESSKVLQRIAAYHYQETGHASTT